MFLLMTLQVQSYSEKVELIKGYRTFTLLPLDSYISPYIYFHSTILYN